MLAGGVVAGVAAMMGKVTLWRGVNHSSRATES